jgi:hypothetical protein
MRRLLLLLAVAIAAVGIWLALRGGGSAEANARVTSLLPRDTVVFVHVPDFNRTREQWRETDIYKLWREPAVQDFLQKPLAQMPNQTSAAEERMQQLERLGIKDGFVAITSLQADRPAMVGGFRFKANKSETEKVLGEWRGMLQTAADAKPEIVQHQRHRIEVLRRAATTLATVYDGDWFFAANDVAALTALLDRTKTRSADAAATLGADPDFSASVKRMPGGYAGFAFARVEPFLARLAARYPQNESNASRLDVLRQVRSVSAATTFDGGKIRDVLFAQMPKSAEQGELTRSSLGIATPETFLYVATLLTLPRDMGAATNVVPMPGVGFAAGVQRFVAPLVQSGINVEDWNAAFGADLGVIGEWPVNARIPSLLATLPVKDATKADELVSRMTAAAVEGSRWAMTERDAVRYYSQVPQNPLVPVAPTIGIGSQRAVAGLDAASVEAAMKRAPGDGDTGLAASETFRTAEGMINAPNRSSAYVDTALLYTRLDAALRPMLVMGAAFVPAIAQAIDLSKVPPAEVITRHLSPIVMSQRYDGDGYVTESAGPVSIFQAALGVGIASGAGATWYHSNMVAPAPPSPKSPPIASPSPAATP